MKFGDQNNELWVLMYCEEQITDIVKEALDDHTNDQHEFMKQGLIILDNFLELTSFDFD